MPLPIKTTAEDIEVVTTYLKNKVGWVPISTIKTAIATKYVDARKLDAMQFLSLIEKKDQTIKLSDSGRRFADGATPQRRSGLATAIRRDRSFQLANARLLAA